MSTKHATDGDVRKAVPVSSYEVGGHLIHLSGFEGRWSVTVDKAAHHTSFATRAEAWEAGVREADRLDRLQPN
jgi:hypothetical protein